MLLPEPDFVLRKGRIMAIASVGRPFAVAVVLPLILSSCASGPGGGFSMFRLADITWHDTSWCVPWTLKSVLYRVAKRFGPVKVHSTHRWPLENKRKGGKPKSFHLSCRAIDFSVPGDPSQVKAYLVSQWEVGGYSYYSQGFYHMDNGRRRTW
jgi:hypothetical protein